MEAYLETDGRELLRLLLQEQLDQQGRARVGEAVCGSDGVVRSYKRDHMETGFAEAKRRDPEQQAEWVVLVDGDLTQLDDIEQTAKTLGVEVVIILDIIHVLEYLWKAAKSWLSCEDPKIAQWVCDKTAQVLQGEVKSVVRNLRRGATAKRMSSKQREPIDKWATYLSNHALYLNYPLYLAKGYPIATGVIEGACRHLVKDRMEITGARWGLQGGEAVLKLRALVINGDFEAYWAFHEQQDYQRNHQSKFSEMPTAGPRLKLIALGVKDGCRHDHVAERFHSTPIVTPSINHCSNRPHPSSSSWTTKSASASKGLSF